MDVGKSTHSNGTGLRYGNPKLPYDLGKVTIPHGSLKPSMVWSGLYELASITTTLPDRPHANRIFESSGVNVKCQHRWPVGISARRLRESAENTWSLRAIAAETKMRLPARSKVRP